MDIVKLDTEELERYFAQHTLDDATVGKALEKFEKGFNLDTKLVDVKKLEQNLRDRVSPEDREYFCMKILSYVVDITNRNLPVNAEESKELLASRYLGAEDGAWAQAAINDLRNAFFFLDRWEPDPTPSSLFQQLHDQYKQTYRAMCESAGQLIITDAEMEEWQKRSEERKKEQKKKWIIAAILFVIGFHLVSYIVSLFSNG